MPVLAIYRFERMIHMPTGFEIDLIFRKTRSFSMEEFIGRQQALFLGQPRWFTTAEDIILIKLEWSKIGRSERQFTYLWDVPHIDENCCQLSIIIDLLNLS